MTATLTIDPSGGISLPSIFMEKFGLKPGAKLRADINDDGLALMPSSESPNEKGLALLDKAGFLVITGTDPFDAVDAIAAARADRDLELTSGSGK